MALVFDGTNKRFAERLDDLEGEVFGPDGSAYRLGNRLALLEAAITGVDGGTPASTYSDAIAVDGGVP